MKLDDMQNNLVRCYEMTLICTGGISNKEIIKKTAQTLSFASKRNASGVLSELHRLGVIKCDGGFSTIEN